MESALPFDYVEFDKSVETTGKHYSLVVQLTYNAAAAAAAVSVLLFYDIKHL